MKVTFTFVFVSVLWLGSAYAQDDGNPDASKVEAGETSPLPERTTSSLAKKASEKDGKPDQANRMMKELENSIAGMDEDNPDPKQMGSLMRRMCELSGENMDEPMEEVVRKLEEGMNPEELEERMGDFMGNEDDGESPDLPDDGNESAQSKLKRLLMKRPQRDPTLYDFRDYLGTN